MIDTGHPVPDRLEVLPEGNQAPRVEIVQRAVVDDLEQMVEGGGESSKGMLQWRGLLGISPNHDSSLVERTFEIKVSAAGLCIWEGGAAGSWLGELQSLDRGAASQLVRTYRRFVRRLGRRDLLRW